MHMLEGFDTIFTPQRQHAMVGIASSPELGGSSDKPRPVLILERKVEKQQNKIDRHSWTKV
jgi:hypothetical protein